MSDDEFRRDEIIPMIPVAVTCVYENQTLFDDDGWMSTPLLDSGRNHTYANYRYQYAEMLQIWGQPLSRLEIMKFNVLKQDNVNNSGMISSGTAEHMYHEGHTPGDNSHSHSAGAASPTVPFGGRKEQLHALLNSGRGLDVTGICRTHETQLDPVEYSRATHGLVGGAVGTCHRCQPYSKIPQTQLFCVYCCEPVDALYPPCLSCGCASHEACLAEWHAMGETECPAGDECNCVEEASNGQVESWPALRAAVALARMKATASVGEKSSGAAGKKTGPSGKLRPRRRSVPANLGTYAESDSEMTDEGDGVVVSSGAASNGAGGGDDYDIDREDWESVASSKGIPSVNAGGGELSAGYKPSPWGGNEPISAARLSLGNRLKKSLAESGRPSALRRKSGGVWKTGGGS